MKLLTKVYAVYDRIVEAMNWVAFVIMYAALLLVLREVLIMRPFFGKPEMWMTEVTAHGITFIAFLSTAWVLKRNRHIVMDLMLSRLNPKNQLMTNTITSIIGAIICFILMWYGIRSTWQSYVWGQVTTESLRWPVYLLLWIIPVGLFMFGIQFLARANRYRRRWREGIKTPERRPDTA